MTKTCMHLFKRFTTHDIRRFLSDIHKNKASYKGVAIITRKWPVLQYHKLCSLSSAKKTLFSKILEIDADVRQFLYQLGHLVH